MATLAELLAELPDNNTGLIDAAHVRFVVTALWERGTELQAQVDALNFTIQSYYYDFAQSAGASPASARLSSLVPTGPLADVDTLYVNKMDGEDTDRSLAFSTLEVGSLVNIGARDDADVAVRFDITGPGVKTGDVWAIPVAVQSGAPVNWPFANFQQLVASFRILFTT